MNQLRNAVAILIAALCFNCANTGNILCLMGVALPTHQVWSNVLFEALAAKGHQLTFVSSDLPDDPTPNINFIHLEATYEGMDKYYQDLYTKGFKPLHSFKNMLLWYERQMSTCKGILASQGFKKTIELGTKLHQRYDLIIHDTTYGPCCLLSLAHLFPEAPIVGLSAFKVIPDTFEMARGGMISPALVPFFSTSFDAQMSYWQRLYNTALYGASYFMRHFVIYPVNNGMMMQDLNVQKAQLSLTVEDLLARVKVILVNTHPVTDFVQPLPPNIVEVGGMQIAERSQDLPVDLKKFVEREADGTVYISIGPIEMLGQKRVEAILKMLRRLSNYNFLWQVVNVDMIKDPPENLYLSDWFPQNDVLAHPNIKAFLTNGDSMSIQAAIYYGVPVLALPFSRDQSNNAQRICTRGAAIFLEFDEFNEDTVFHAIMTIFQQPGYAQEMKKLQLAFLNRAQHPLNTAVWWVEQILAHPKSCDYLVPKTGGQLGYFVAHSLDIIALVVVFILALFINSYIVIKNTWQSFRKTSQNHLKDTKIGSKVARKSKIKKN